MGGSFFLRLPAWYLRLAFLLAFRVPLTLQSHERTLNNHEPTAHG